MNDKAVAKEKKKMVRSVVRNSAKKSWTMRLSYLLTVLGTGFAWFLEQFPFYREKLSAETVLWAIPAIGLLVGFTRLRSLVRDAKAAFDD